MNDVFISYSRRDKVFTQKLFEALKGANRIVWADWDSIPAASDWDAEIKEGIEQAESVLFLLSPEWIKSNECRKELNHAITMGKRLIPILYQMVDPNEVPPELAKINWVYMRDTDNFDKAFVTLCAAMDTDLEWVKTHTRIQVRAVEWDKKKRENSFVLRGKDLADGEKFVSEAAGKSPEPTALQGEYILASRKDAIRRQRMTLTGVTIALVVSIALGIAALIQRQVAVTQRNRAVVAESTAVSAKSTAVAERDRADLNAKMSFARELNAEAKNNLDKDPERSILLAMKAADVTIGAGQPVMMDTYDSLRRAVQESRVRYALDTGNADVWAVEFNPSGDRLAAGSGTGVVTIWDTASILNSPGGSITVQPILTLPHTGKPGSVMSISFSPDGKQLAVAYDAKITISDAVNGQTLQTLDHTDVQDVAYSPDGTLLASGGNDGAIKLWDVQTGKLVFTPSDQMDPNGRGPIWSVAFSPDGKKLAASNNVMSNADQGWVDLPPNVNIWDIKTEHLDSTLVYSCYGINDIAFSPDGKNLATGEDCDGVTVRIAKLDALDFFAGDSGAPVAGYGSVSFAPTISFVYMASVPDQLLPLKFHSDSVYDVAFSPSGEFLASASIDQTVSVVDAQNGSLKFKLFDTSSVYSTTYSPDGRFIVTGNKAGQVKLWDASTVGQSETGQFEIAKNQVLNQLTYNPDGSSIATTSYDRDMSSTGKAMTLDAQEPINVHIWPLIGDQSLKFKEEGADIAVTSISPNGKNIFTLSTYAGLCNIVVRDAVSGEKINTLSNPKCEGNFNYLNSMSLSPDGALIATGSDSFITVWDVKTGKIAREWSQENDYFYNVTFSPDGNSLASGYTRISLWDAATGKAIKDFGENNDLKITALAFSRDGKQVLAGYDDGTATVWDIESGTAVFNLTGHTGKINQAVYSPEGAQIATASADGTARIWNAATGDLLTTISAFAGNVADLAFSPDGKTLATGSADSGVRFYTVKFEDLLALAKTRLTRSFTLKECQTYLHTDQCPAKP